jgi:hypothetical protein
VNLIPSTASPLASPSYDLVQAMLSRANLPIETVALAVCILDSLDAKFARTWRLSCPLTGAAITSPTTSSSKRHTMPPELLSATYRQRAQQQQLHIDAVRPELIVLAALVIAAKFTEDPQEPSCYYCSAWGRGLWTTEQLNATELCIMNKLEYRILPLYNDDVLTDAMVDMQLAARQCDWHGGRARQPTPPEAEGLALVVTTTTAASNGDRLGPEDSFYVPAHSRSKTTANIQGFALSAAEGSASTTPTN